MFDHVRFGEPRHVGTQPGLLVDQGADEVVVGEGRQGGVAPAHRAVQHRADGEVDGGGFGVPAAGEQARGEGVVLGWAGGQRRLVVGLHP